MRQLSLRSTHVKNAMLRLTREQIVNQRMNVLLLIIVCVLAVIIFIFGINAYPQMSPDAIAFGPPVITLGSTGVLRVSLSSDYLFPQSISDFMGVLEPQGRYIWYPPLFYMVVAALLPDYTAQGYFVVIAFIGVLTFVMGTILILVNSRPRSLIGWIGLLSGVIALAHYVTGSQNGRPELMAAVIVIIGVIALPLNIRKLIWIWGTLLGLLLAGHIITGLISLILIGLFLSTRYDWRGTLLSFSAIIVISVLTATLVFVMNPNGILDTVRGTLFHAQMIGGRVVLEPFIQYYVFNVRAMFLGVIVCAAFAVKISETMKYRGQVKSQLLHLVFWMLLLFMIFFSSVKNVYTYYNIVPFIPLLITILVRMVSTTSSFDCFTKTNLTRAVTLAVLTLPTVGLVRDLGLYTLYVDRGVSLHEARNLFEGLSTIHDKTVEISISMWALTENYEQLSVLNSIDKVESQYVIFQQNGTSLETPPDFPGYTIIADYFLSRPEGIYRTLANTVPGYAFAVYERQAR